MILVGDIMSLGEKILKLRKKKGLSQEELGDKINVTRQTISNWELGETSPNPNQLKLLSRELGVSIDELLDNDIKDIVVEKVSNTEKLSKTILTILKVILYIVISIIVIWIILIIARSIVKTNKETSSNKLDKTIHCSLYGEEHSFGIRYYELTGEPIELGGDTYFSDILDLGKYDDANQIFNVINDYVKKNGGTCKLIDNKDMNDIVNIEIKEGTLTNTGATIIITENIDYDIIYCKEYKIAKYNYQTNVWEDLPVICKNCDFTLMAYTVTPDHPLEFKMNWEDLYGKLEKGQYKIIKTVSFDSDRPITDNDIFEISIEFSIE